MAEKKRKHPAKILLPVILLLLTPLAAYAQYPDGEGPYDFDAGLEEEVEEQLDALGRDELMGRVPEEARELLDEAGLYEMSPQNLLQMTPGDFFSALWRMALDALSKPARTLAAMLGIILLCALLQSLGAAAWENALSGVFQTVSVLCILTAVAAPVLSCIIRTTNTIRDASVFMLSFIPVFSASMVSAGQAVTGATYNLFLLGVCGLISQIVAQTLIPLMSVYLALCICGSFVPDFNIASAASGIKSAVSWTLGFLLTLFVALLSIQTMLSQSADGVGLRATKFLINSLVPVVGSVLSEAYMAAQGCLRLVKTTVGVYGIIVALFIFLPTFLQVAAWYLATKIVAVAGDIAGAAEVSAVLKSCSNVLGLLIAVLFCFALLVIVSTGVVIVAGMGISG